MSPKTKKILSIIIVVLIVLIVGRNMIISTGIKAGAKAAVGLDVKIGKFHLGVFKSYVQIKDFKVKNPKGFAEPLMVNIPEVYVDYNLGSILGGNVHLEELRFNMEEFVVVKKADGTVNLDAITALGKKDDAKEDTKADKAKDKPKGKAPDIEIDNLHLKIGKVKMIDYTGGGEPKIKEYTIGIDEKHENIKNTTALVSLIVFKALFKTPIANVVDIDLGGLQDAVGGSFKAVSGVATKTLDSATDSSKKVLEGTSDKLKGAGGKLKGLLKKVTD